MITLKNGVEKRMEDVLLNREVNNKLTFKVTLKKGKTNV
jgi:hypothetical protein